MRIGSLNEAAAKLGVSRQQLDRLASQGKLHTIHSEHPKAPVFTTDQALRDAGFEPPESFGEPSVEAILTDLARNLASELLQIIAEQRQKIDELERRVRALEALHS